jgi:hypothetical protein
VTNALVYEIGRITFDMKAPGVALVMWIESPSGGYWQTAYKVGLKFGRRKLIFSAGDGKGRRQKEVDYITASSDHDDDFDGCDEPAPGGDDSSDSEEDSEDE